MKFGENLLHRRKSSPPNFIKIFINHLPLKKGKYVLFLQRNAFRDCNSLRRFFFILHVQAFNRLKRFEGWIKSNEGEHEL